MQHTTVKQGQSLYDKVLEATGDITNVFVMAQANALSITDVVASGTVLTVAGSIKKNMVALLTDKYAPATLQEPPAPQTYYLLPQTFPVL